MAKNGYDFYLKQCLLPIAPEKVQIKINNANETIALIDEGEINLLKKAKLTDIEFECVIPQVKYPFAVYLDGFKPASYYLDYLETLKVSQKPFQFIIARTMPSGKNLFNTNMKVSLESYSVTEQAKNGFDLTVKIKLKQYRDYGTKTVEVKVARSKTEPVATAMIQEQRETENSPTPVANEMYTVVSGDCLFNIAKKYYGNGSKYPIIADTNNLSNPNLIYTGQVLTIPAI